MNAFNKLLQLEQESNEFGFEWPNVEMIIKQAISECHEIKDAIDQNEPTQRVQEEIGDLLHAAISLCVFLEIDVEQTLSFIVAKFSARLKALKAITHQQGFNNLKGQPISILLDLWEQVKKTKNTGV